MNLERADGAAATAESGPENVLWAGHPSQWVNFGYYLLCVLFCWLIVPLFMAAWRWISTRCNSFELTTERLRHRQGVLSRSLDEVELYRVKDMTVEQSLLQRMVGLSTIRLVTSDRTSPTVVLPCITDADRVKELIRRQVEINRRRKGVREVDYE